jgi:aminopeptidase N
MSSKQVRRLFEGFQPDHYVLDLKPNREAMTLEGTVTITGKKTGRPSQRLTLHQNGLNARSAIITKHEKSGQKAIEVDRINGQSSLNELRLHTKEKLFAGYYTITIEFSGKIQESMHGVYVCNYEYQGKKQQLVATQFESHHARECFPCIDEPEAKATFDLTLTTPKGEAVVANTPVKDQVEHGAQLVTTFETTPRMSTYLLAFVYGDMHSKSAKTKNGIQVSTWSTKAQPLTSMDWALDVATRAIEFFEDYYGVPYPLAKCDHVALPDFSSAAMENWGCITYRESCLLIDPTKRVAGHQTMDSGRDYP